MFQYDVCHMTKTTATPIHGESRQNILKNQLTDLKELDF